MQTTRTSGPDLRPVRTGVFVRTGVKKWRPYVRYGPDVRPVDITRTFREALSDIVPQVVEAIYNKMQSLFMQVIFVLYAWNVYNDVKTYEKN